MNDKEKKIKTLEVEVDKNLELVRHMIVENRAMQTKILQLNSDLAISRDDMSRFIKNATDDKIRIVEHQQTLVEQNMTLQSKYEELQQQYSQLKQMKQIIPKQ